jgi:hypothetical protein
MWILHDDVILNETSKHETAFNGLHLHSFRLQSKKARCTATTACP